MKKENGFWKFQSYDEIRAFVAQGFPCDVYLESCMYKRVVKDKVFNDNAQTFSGPIENYPVDSFVTRHNFERVEFSSEDILAAFYQAGEHFASVLRTAKDEVRTVFTAKELATSFCNGVAFPADPARTKELLYTMSSGTGKYQVAEDYLFEMIDAMERACNIGPAKRHHFTVKNILDEDRNILVRLTFDVDKLLPKMKKCWDTSELRPTMMQPVIELSTGIMICSDGHILAAHKLKNYHSEIISKPSEDVINIPREVVSMKGTVTIEIEEKSFKAENSDEMISGFLVTAQDSKGKQGTYKHTDRYPKWRSVFPNKIGKALKIDAQAWSDAVKRIMPHINGYSQLMWMDGERSASSVSFCGVDYDFSKDVKIDVPVPKALSYGVWCGVKAPTFLNTLAFEPDVMYFTDPTRALLFSNEDTMLICMPMLLNDEPSTPRGPRAEEMMSFSIDSWAKKPVKESVKKTQVKVAAKAKTIVKAITEEAPKPLSIEERLREALRKQLAVPVAA